MKFKLSIVFLFFSSGYIYWCYKVWKILGLSFVKWHTHLFVYAVLFFVFYWFFKCLEIHKNNELVKKIKLSAFRTWLTLLILESILLTGFGFVKTYSERNNGTYVSLYEPMFKGHYHRYPPKTTMENFKTEFSYIRKTNSQGFVDQDWPLEKKQGEKRILALGDSYTEGDGAHFDSSYVSALRKLLPANYSIMNGGICGSDPIYNIKNLEDIFLKYQPDIVLQTIDANDIIFDIRTRGGAERFNYDGNVVFKTKPSWEAIYAISNVVRLLSFIAGYDYSLMKSLDEEETNKIFKVVKTDVIEKYKMLSSQYHFKVYFILKKSYDEIYYGYNSDILEKFRHLFVSDYDLKIIELAPCYLSKVKNKKEKLESYFWPIDKHHNGIGYQMMAECIYNQLKDEVE